MSQPSVDAGQQQDKWMHGFAEKVRQDDKKLQCAYEKLHNLNATAEQRFSPGAIDHQRQLLRTFEDEIETLQETGFSFDRKIATVEERKNLINLHRVQLQEEILKLNAELEQQHGL
jgi:hypothetical protein